VVMMRVPIGMIMRVVVGVAHVVPRELNGQPALPTKRSSQWIV